MSVAIRLNNPPIPLPFTGETFVWVWIWHNQTDWAPKAAASQATRFKTSDDAQAMIDKFKLAQYGAQIVQLQ